MRSIKARFNKEIKKEPISSYIAFRRAVFGQRFTERAIRENFNDLVEREDYTPGVKRILVEQLLKATEERIL